MLRKATSLLGWGAAIALTLCFSLISLTHAHAATPSDATNVQLVRKASSPRRDTAMSWALKQRGKPYIWAGIGPSGFDCSGLVMEAYAHAGVSLPHNTVAMLDSGKLTRTTHPVWGDLAFFGTGHVELFDRRGWTFGAHHSGTAISYRAYNSYYAPTAFYHVNGAN